MSIRLTPVGLAVAAPCTLGCEHAPLFPPTVLERTDTAFDFSAWRMTPNVQIGHKIQMGGRIVDLQEKDGMLRPSITQLPIVAHPAYGPTDTGQSTGEFLALLRRPIPVRQLQAGNRGMVVGVTESSTIALADAAKRIFPTMQAQCVHIWNTGGREIAEFPSIGRGYQPPEENTYCVDG